MAEYIYRGKKSGQQVSGSMEGQSKNDILIKLDSLGVFPTYLEEKKINTKTPTKIPLKEIVEFTHQLSTLINSGSPLLTSLNTLTTETEQIKLKPVLLDIVGSIKEGKSFSESLKKYPKVFSPFYVSLVKIGETSGTLGENLKRIAEFLEGEMEFKSNLTSVLTYPLIIIFIGIVTVFVLLKFVIPKIVVIFQDLGQALPLPTVMLINISKIFSDYWLFIIIGSVMVFFWLKRNYQKPKNKLIWHKKIFNLPLLGEILKKIEVCRLARTLSVLIKNGVPLDMSLNVLKATTTNLFVGEEITELESRIKEGSSLHEALKKSPLFNKGFINVVMIGEESGRLEEVLAIVSNDYNKDIDRKMKTFMNLLEPMLILTVGLVIGFIVLSMLLPIFQLDFNVG